MYNQTLAYEVCKTHVDDTSTKMYTNDIKRQGKFAIFFGVYRRSGTPRNGGSEIIEARTIVGRSVKNAERPLEKQ